MKVLCVNAGSSSLKFQLYDMPAEISIIGGYVEKIGAKDSFYTIKFEGKKTEVKKEINDHADAVAVMLEELVNYGAVKDLSEIRGVGHRVVHGGEKYAHSVVITDEVMKDIKEFTKFAPLHHPGNIAGIKAMQKALPEAVQVAVFDTAFHQTIPKIQYMYPVPMKWYEKYGVRKYGFHGTSHRFVTAEAASILGKKPEDCCFITAHLGNGSSCSAILNGKCADTTMGFTPLDGLIMGTRSGSLDPAILFFISKKYGYDIDRLDKLVNKESGLLGLSGLSNDMRTLTQAASEGHVGAQIALETFCYKLTREIGGIAMALPRIDALVFTGGIGENSRVVRKTVMENLALLGYQIDDARNEDNGKNSGHIISKDGTPTAMVVATNEELLIALDTEALVK